MSDPGAASRYSEHWAPRLELAPFSVAFLRASIDPDNVPSLGVVEKLGFRLTGRRWDDEDGWELTFERVVLRS